MKLGVFIVPEYHPDTANGGAENICRLVTLSLCNYFDIIVFHSERSKEAHLGIIKKHNNKLQSINAFYLDEWTRNRGEVTPVFCDTANSMMQGCDIIISFERTLANVKQPQITVLGGISYQHCEDIAKSKKWNRLIVPSIFIKNKCCELGADANSIVVIPNGIKCENFFKTNNNVTNNVLLPFRPDYGKGFFESIDFVSEINQNKNYGIYKLLIPKLVSSDFSDVSFYEKIDLYATEKNVVIQYIPWGTEKTMNSIYNMSDFILSIGTLEEGFGLITIETILSGRYIVTRKLGATPELMPNNWGIIFIEDNSVDEIMEKITHRKSNNEELVLGKKYIHSHYTVENMCSNFLRVIYFIVTELL